MTNNEIPIEAVAARKAQHLRNIAELDYHRNLLLLQQRGFRKEEISNFLKISPQNLQKVLQSAAGTPMPCEGFSGVGPYEICERYAAGLIDRAQLVEELTRWEYLPPALTKDLLDDLLFDVPGSVDDLENALRRGLIDRELFYEIGDRKNARKKAV